MSDRSRPRPRFFRTIINGEGVIGSLEDAWHFLETIIAQADHLDCLQKIIGDHRTRNALRSTLKYDVLPKFFNGLFMRFLRVIEQPAVQYACKGNLFRDLREVLTEPGAPCIDLHHAQPQNQLQPSGAFAFAWLLLKLVACADLQFIQTRSPAEVLTLRKYFLQYKNIEDETVDYGIQHNLSCTSYNFRTKVYRPGGRHDNDFSDYRRIAVLPTSEELMSKEQPFYRTADSISAVPIGAITGNHLDNQFRLMREDFLFKLREIVSNGITDDEKQCQKIRGLSFEGFFSGDKDCFCPFGLVLSAKQGLGRLKELQRKKREMFLEENLNFLKDHSIGCVMEKSCVISFVSLHRVNEFLLESEPCIVLRAHDRTSLENLLTALISGRTLDFVMVDTVQFAYEPILRSLQTKTESPLWNELLANRELHRKSVVRSFTKDRFEVAQTLRNANGCDIKTMLNLAKPVDLDGAQRESLFTGMIQPVSLIHGPPGTGKSFIGSLLTKALFKTTPKTILILCYTNHALDQFLEGILEIGIEPKDIVRLGSKSIEQTRALLLSQQHSNARPSISFVQEMKASLNESRLALKELIGPLKEHDSSRSGILDLLNSIDNEFYRAFWIPRTRSGRKLLDTKGKELSRLYLINRWYWNLDAGILSEYALEKYGFVWKMNNEDRKSKMNQWRKESVKSLVSTVCDWVDAYGLRQIAYQEARKQGDIEIVQRKRIIACTTTAAAMYSELLRSASPKITIVEEAGEVLESHILTAIKPGTQQLILIGDHKQLGPKVSHYDLSVESGNGYDLNRSLFERLILAGYPHTTLVKQHRMCPEISTLCRTMTYPSLIDADTVLNRCQINGLRSRVVFVDHQNAETSESPVNRRLQDDGDLTSKQNKWEASMIPRIVKYMAQRGYSIERQVVLTPYRSQMDLIRSQVAKQNDCLTAYAYAQSSDPAVDAALGSPPSTAHRQQEVKVSTIGQ